MYPSIYHSSTSLLLLFLFPSISLLRGLLDLVHRVANHSLSLVRGIPHRLLCGLDGSGLLHLLVTQEGEEDVVADLDGVDVELFLFCVCVCGRRVSVSVYLERKGA